MLMDGLDYILDWWRVPPISSTSGELRLYPRLVESSAYILDR
jgi:hypothetical protein